jgi:CheY-like chemotaxis protein
VSARQGLKALERARAEPRSILVVDDEPGIVDVLLTVLVDARFRAVGAAHGEEAVAKLRSWTPDMVLLDLEMAVMDGAETLRVIKSTPRLASVRVVMMSGLPESMVKRRCRGYDAFLRKPFTLEDLLLTLRRVLGSAKRKVASRNKRVTRRK